jgi:hypothetical protein
VAAIKVAIYAVSTSGFKGVRLKEGKNRPTGYHGAGL